MINARDKKSSLGHPIYRTEFGIVPSLLLNFDKVDRLDPPDSVQVLNAMVPPSQAVCFGPDNFLETYQLENHRYKFYRQFLLVPIFCITSAALFSALYSTLLQL